MSNASVTITVDGRQFEQDANRLSAMDILEASREHGIITEDPSEYDLQSLDADDKVFTPDEVIDPSTDREFLALPNGPTPVA